ncbi:MAG: DUF3667 domain-containing protein [Gemmatimonadaceae bacterium]|nr:DUF3667 domain-containing protein [Gemmatimonadaceae bacterium]
MAHDENPTTEARDEAPSPAESGQPDPASGVPDEGSGAAEPEAAAPRRFTLASLLDLDDADLAEPLSRTAPPEHRWEQLSLRVTPETGEAIPSSIRSGQASSPPGGEMELIPGLDDPGAVEVPVYLAGRTLFEFLHPTGEADPPQAAPVEQPDQADWAVSGAIEPPKLLASAVEEPASVHKPTPAHVKPLALATKSVRRPRRRMDAPVANFEKSESASVLWPSRRSPTTPGIIVRECARCRAPFTAERCESCGHGESVAPRLAPLSAPQRLVGYLLDHKSRAVRTISALLLAPGELTADYLAGHRRRYFGPGVVFGIAIVILLATCMLAGLRPRPDRALAIGDDRTELAAAGLADRQITGTMYEQPDAVRDTLQLVNRFPVVWVALMLLGVLSVVAAMRITQRRDGPAEMVFTAHFTGWFVVWWALLVPASLLLLRWGFEYAAVLNDVTAVRYIDDGQVAGMSRIWNALRAMVITPWFHSALLACGIVPWCVLAYRRAFEDPWARAIVAGVITAAVPLLLLLPFA